MSRCWAAGHRELGHCRVAKERERLPCSSSVSFSFESYGALDVRT